MAYDGDNCQTCAGSGEIDLPDVQRLGPVPCPECVSGELHDRIAELEAALREIAAGDIDEHGNRRNHVIIARSALHI